MSERTCLYFMRNERNGFWKIGISKDPVFREKTLQSEEPEIVLGPEIWFESRATARWAEKFTHWLNRSRRLRGEWFRMTEGDVEDALEAVQATLWWHEYDWDGDELMTAAVQAYRAEVAA